MRRDEGPLAVIGVIWRNEGAAGWRRYLVRRFRFSGRLVLCELVDLPLDQPPQHR